MHPPADRALTRPAMPAHGLIHNHHQRSIGIVSSGECAAFQQGDAHDLKEITVGNREVREFQLPLFCRFSLNGVCSACEIAGRRKNAGHACGNCSRLARKTIHNRPPEIGDRSLCGILIQRQLVTGNCNVLSTESGIDGAHLLKAAQKRSGCRQ